MDNYREGNEDSFFLFVVPYAKHIHFFKATSGRPYVSYMNFIFNCELAYYLYFRMQFFRDWLTDLKNLDVIRQSLGPRVLLRPLPKLNGHHPV